MGIALELFVLLALGFASLRIGWPIPAALLVGYLCLLSLRVTPISRKTSFPTRFGFWVALFVGIWLLMGWGYASVFDSALDTEPSGTTYRFFFDGPALAVFWGYILAGVVTLALFAAALIPAAALVSRTMFGKYDQYEGHTRDATLSALGVMLGIDQGTCLVKNGKAEVIEKPKGRLARFGGPGKLIVQEGHAVILEKNGKINRVVGSDLTWLEPFEMISMIVPLQLRTERVLVSEVVTRDRIVLEDVEVFVFHGADPGSENQRIHDGQYVYNPEILREKVWSPSGNDWRDAVKSISSRAVRDVVGRYYLEQLFPLVGDNRAGFLKNLKARIEEITEKIGVQVVVVDVGLLRVPTETRSRLLEQWIAEWDQHVDLKRAETSQKVQGHKTQARVDNIKAVSEGLKQLLGSEADPQDLVALRFIEYLEQRDEGSAPHNGSDTDALLKIQGLQALRSLRFG